jgi:predicted MFS family arabinose efflux permease
VLPLLMTSLFLAAGGLVYSRTYAARTWRPLEPGGVDGARGGSPLRSRAFWLTMAVALCLAAGFGQLDVTITATGERVFDSTALLGVLFACIAGGSTVGGLWYGSRRWRGPERRHLPVTLACFSAGLFVIVLVLGLGGPPLGLLLPTMVLTGLAIAPGLIVLQALTDAHTEPDRRGEAQGWLATAITSGAAIGMAIAGVVIDRSGPRASFGAAAIAVGLAAAVALASQRLLRTPHPADPEPAVPVKTAG